jgi:hypothetical protein
VRVERGTAGALDPLRRPTWADLGGKLANDNGDQAWHHGTIDDLHVDRLEGRVDEPAVDNEVTEAHLGTLQDHGIGQNVQQ